jgi:Helix-turn-helix domain
LSGQEIAILHTRDCGVREIARRLGRSASTSPMTNQSRGATVVSWVTQKGVASPTGIENNLLPYWLTQFPDRPLGAIEVPDEAGRQVRAYGEAGDEMALRIFGAMALGGCSQLRRTTPTRVCTSSAALSWKAHPRFGTGSWARSVSTPCYAMNRRDWPASQLYRTSTSLGPGALL